MVNTPKKKVSSLIIGEIMNKNTVTENHHKCNKHTNCEHYHYSFHSIDTPMNNLLEPERTSNIFCKVLTDENAIPTVSTTPTGLSPLQIRKAYGLNNIAADGTGQKVAIINAYNCPTAVTDFKTFDKKFGINKPNNLTIKSFATSSDQDWAMEISMDIQWIHAIAPNAKILLVCAKSNSLPDLITAINYANNNGATVISMSWGSNEFINQTYFESCFSKQSCVYLAASGDTSVVSWPSASPKVLAVGGTTISVTAQGIRNGVVNEIGWSGSGGGKSVYEPLPDYQSTIGIVGKRTTPDVGICANPGVSVLNTYGYGNQRGWFKVGGTSLSSVLWAGIIVLTNQIRTSKNKSVLSTSLLHNYLYSTVGTDKYIRDFYDITIGTSGANTTKINYDTVVGLGTPKNTSPLNGLINDLATLIP